MPINKFAATAAVLFCSFNVFANVTTASQLFRVEAEYRRPDFSDRGFDVKLSQIIDHLNFTVEVKDEQLQAVAKILNYEDGKTSYVEDMKPEFSVGEYCTGVQTSEGVYEAFNLKDGPAAQAIVVREPVQPPNIPVPPGTPGMAPGFPQGKPSYKVTTVLDGVEHLRGWNFSVEQILCNLQDIPEADSEKPINLSLEFDSKNLKTAGSSIVVDKTENGFGWIFTIIKQ